LTNLLLIVGVLLDCDRSDLLNLGIPDAFFVGSLCTAITTVLSDRSFGDKLGSAVLTDFRYSDVAAHCASLFGLFLYQRVTGCISLYLYVTSSHRCSKNLLLPTNLFLIPTY